MKNVYIYCEGQTEESFVNKILYPYFLNQDIAVYPIICSTKRTLQRKYKGGVYDYNKIRNELTILCKSHRHEFVSTMFDYYGMPDNTPGFGIRRSDPVEMIDAIEAEINKDLDLPNCSFHLMLHEFEGILFSNPESFRIITDEKTVEAIQQIRDEFPTPEHINNSMETAPSKRLLQMIPGYSKIRSGMILSIDMGIDSILQQCPHFKEWIELIVSRA